MSKIEIENEQTSNNNEIEYELNSMVWGGDLNTSLLLEAYGKNEIERFINDPMTYHVQLNEIIESLYNIDGVLFQSIQKRMSSPTLAKILIPRVINKSNIQKRTKAEQVLSDLNHHLITRDSLRSHDLFGQSCFILDERPVGKSKKRQYTLKPLHQNFFKFVGVLNGDHIVAFDLDYFEWERDNLNSEYSEFVEITEVLKTFPTEFAIAYNDYKNNSAKRWFVLNQETTYATKARASLLEPYGRSITLTGIKDILFSQEYTESQRSNLKQYISQLLYMVLPESESKGHCSLNSKQQKEQNNVFIKAVMQQYNKRPGFAPSANAFVVAPGSKIDKVTVNPDLLKDTLKNENKEQIASNVGLGLGAISGSGGATNYASLALNMKLVMSEIYEFLEQSSKQYEKIVNHILNSNENNYIKFKYLKVSNHDKEEVFNTAKELFTLTSGSREYLYAVGTDDAMSYIDLMELENLLDYDNRFAPHLTSFTANGKKNTEETDVGGRPPKALDKLEGAGIDTRTSGGNEAEKPSV